MKKLVLLLMMACVALPGMVFTSCSDDDDDNGNGNGNYSNYPYSDLTPEQQREKLEEDANEFLNKIQDLNTNEGALVLVNLSDLLDNEVVDVSKEKSSLQRALKAAEKLIKISDFYYTHTWNFEDEIWDREENNKNQLEFYFPASSENDENNAEIIATAESSSYYYSYNEEYDYDYQTGKEEYREVTIEIPKKVSAVINKDKVKVGSFEMNATVKGNNQVPSDVSTTLNLNPYVLTATMKKGDKSTSNATLKKQNEVLIDAYADFTGNLDELLENALNEDDDDYDEYPYYNSTMKGNVEIKLMNDLVLVGYMDFQSYLNKLSKLEEDYDESDEDYEVRDENYEKGAAEAFNNYSNIYLVSTTDKAKIASVKAQAKKESSGYYYETIYVLEFKDGVKREVDSYFDGFSEFMSNWEKFINGFYK